jgi:transcriptional regulator with XRE-family HTH domain
MPRNTPQQPLGTVLTLLREVQGWPQNELAVVLGCSPTLVCDYEAGRKPLSRKRLDAIVAALGLPPEAVDRTVAYLAGIRSLSPPEGGTAGLGDSAEAFVARMAANAEAWGRSFLMLDDQRRAQEARHDARFLWERLKPLTPAQRRAQVEASPEFRTWALCELICEKSLEAAADRADRALDLASLAVHVAERAPGLEDWRNRLHGYALAHLANARRVGGDLMAADKVFTRAKKLWEAAELNLRLLEEGRFLHLLGSLRKDQRQLAEALQILSEALLQAGESEKKKILVNKANVLTQMCEFDGAILTLYEVSSLLTDDDDLRLRWLIWFSLANNLLQLDRPREAADLLSKLRVLSMRLDNELDVVRLNWLEGRLAVCLKRHKDAVAILVRVREDLTSREQAYDVALVSLELAALYLDNKQIAEVQSLVRQIYWVFSSQQVHREALAALRLFRTAAEQEDLTVKMVERLVSYLKQARHNPDLRFENV